MHVCVFFQCYIKLILINAIRSKFLSGFHFWCNFSVTVSVILTVHFLSSHYCLYINWVISLFWQSTHRHQQVCFWPDVSTFILRSSSKDMRGDLKSDSYVPLASCSEYDKRRTYRPVELQQFSVCQLAFVKWTSFSLASRQWQKQSLATSVLGSFLYGVVLTVSPCWAKRGLFSQLFRKKTTHMFLCQAVTGETSGSTLFSFGHHTTTKCIVLHEIAIVSS